ncbi:MAG: 3-phenylpropionate-dihydrodiol/cinnamic acid-dihydrodiol dehydrogenase [Acidimicrobiales bacterium]|nr:MAG: SDR family NAD(P)-dependent oxidoreductase [Actinomycetota bacterium]MBV6510300.1 3-phenylpropionate-dihydrodiol/cinnamic acid-dihydrodiol dehydrogenase [Acidimicrobiales bacterium]RIK03384.1 MAG: hypothetical protein DCC48_16675 [Acidobacteriota bacterium]
MDDFEGKTVVVTGGASGIGRALAQRFGRAGMKVVLADIEAEALDKVVAELESDGVDTLGRVTDVADADDVEGLALDAMDHFGAVHVVCNNAGVAGGGRLWEIPLNEWKWVLGVNLWGVIHGVRSFVPRIIEAGGGHVVNVASMAGMVSAPGMSPYNVSKFGVVTLSEALFFELAMTQPGIGVSVVCPGWVNTRIHEADRNRPAELAPEEERRLTPDEEMLRGMIEQLITSGIDPAEVAGLVFDAVRDNRFYVFTGESWIEAARQRFGRIVAGENPQMAIPTADD